MSNQCHNGIISYDYHSKQYLIPKSSFLFLKNESYQNNDLIKRSIYARVGYCDSFESQEMIISNYEEISQNSKDSYELVLFGILLVLLIAFGFVVLKVRR